ncbi:NUDIX hydrolase [Pseudomonas aeruginosa]
MNDVVLHSNKYFDVVFQNNHYTIVEPQEVNGVVVVARCGEPGQPTTKYLVGKQFRKAIKGYSYEFPRGAIDPGEAVLTAAMREILEETGYKIMRSTIFGYIHSNTSIIASRVALVLAEVEQDGELGERDGELESLDWIQEPYLNEMIASGLITDSHTLSARAILAAQGI